jgi:tetratricopeptide (TPR) repeat protein
LASLGFLLEERLGRRGEAIEIYRRLVAVSPDVAWGWLRLGHALQLCEMNWAESESCLRRAIALDGADTAPWACLGQLLAQRDRPAEAAEALRRATALDPQNACAWASLGLLLQSRLGNEAEAEAAYRRSVEIDPAQGQVWRQLGQLLSARPGGGREARAALRKAAELAGQPNLQASRWLPGVAVVIGFIIALSLARHLIDGLID